MTRAAASRNIHKLISAIISKAPFYSRRGGEGEERGAETRVGAAAGRALRNNYEKSLWYLEKKVQNKNSVSIKNSEFGQPNIQRCVRVSQTVSRLLRD